MGKVTIVGVGGDGAAGLSARAREAILGAGTMVGGQRLLDFFPDFAGGRAPLKSDLVSTAAMLAERVQDGNVVVLASGDPCFYGIAAFLVDKLGKDTVEIIPTVSSMQLAFARIKESWDDAVVTSVHGRSLANITGLVRSSRKIGILTDATNSPAAIAHELIAAGLAGYRAVVCEDLGCANERITETDLAGLASLDVSSLNVLVLIRDGEAVQGTTRAGSQALGIPDDQFECRKPLKGLITKSEVRVISLSRLKLREGSVVWDVGAGSGSVSVEAAQIARRGRVCAVERHVADAAIIKRNLQRFGVPNVDVVVGPAPEVLTNLPEPDSVFIGGSGGRLDGILDMVARRLRPGGAVVVNVATISNLDATVVGLKDRTFEVEVTMVNVARSKPVAGLLRFEALDPVFVISAARRA